MSTFFDRVMDRLDNDHPGRSFVFTMDNLNVHHSDLLLQRIEDRGHRYLFRAPYWSVDGPMEYVFNSIHVFLLMYFRSVEDLDELDNRLNTIIAGMGNFVEYFLHVGFPNN